MINQVKLLDVCDFQGGTQPPKNEWISEPQEGYVRMLQIRDYSQGTEKFIEYVKDTGKLHMCNEDDIMLSRYGYIGQAFTGLAGAYNVALVKVIKKREIDTKYLFYYFQSAYFQHSLLSSVGSRATIPGFNKSELENTLIPIPNINEQEKIGTALNKLDKILELHHAQLAKLDELVKARFVELFGNPLDGTAKYPIHQVGEVAEAVDPQPSHRTPSIEEGGIPYVSIKDCDYKTGTINFDGARRVSRKVLEEHLNRYTLQDGDFVIGKIGTIGKPVFVPARNDYTLSANVVLVQPNNELVSPYFLKYSFESDFVERQFSEAKNSTSQAAFGIQKVRAVEVMNPDLDIQRAFERFVKQTDKSKLAIQQSLDKLETLKKSLMQKYFG